MIMWRPRLKSYHRFFLGVLIASMIDLVLTIRMTVLRMVAMVSMFMLLIQASGLHTQSLEQGQFQLLRSWVMAWWSAMEMQTALAMFRATALIVLELLVVLNMALQRAQLSML